MAKTLQDVLDKAASDITHSIAADRRIRAAELWNELTTDDLPDRPWELGA